jgi:glycosyltransferase involved in cell wall biosynthesis
VNQKVNNQPKLSVIVASFNSESYLHKSLQSILNQTFKSFEIIIVDDASTDSTEKVAQYYVENYEQVRYIKNKTNLGCGGTRNVGLKAACGEYVGFMDSDDYIDCNYYKDLYESAIKFGADVVCANIELIYPGEIVKSRLEDNNHISLNTIGEDEIRVIQPEIIVSHWAGVSACTKIIRKTLFDNFPFFEGGASDDIPAIVPILLKANKIVYCPFQ